MYDPGTGTFLQNDPAGSAPSYSFTGGHPTTMSDPTGMFSIGHFFSEWAHDWMTGYHQLREDWDAGPTWAKLTGGVFLAVDAVIGAIAGCTAAPVVCIGVGIGLLADEGSPAYEVPRLPADPTTAPGPDWVWRGNGPRGSSEGNWYNPDTGESLHPDLEHGDPIGPHWDWKDPSKQWWRIFPNGSVEIKA